MARSLPHQVDTVIVGNGPSALILSFILHGHIPVYDTNSSHPDPILHGKLKGYKDLLDVDIDYLTEHFNDSRFSYSTQALPVNVLFDTLNRPLGETDEVEKRPCVKWQHDTSRAVPHVVLGDAPRTGGQWVTNPVEASWDIGALSYAGMLSLPGYSFETFYQSKHKTSLAFYSRPSRREVTDYLEAYPKQVGIDDVIFNGQRAAGISRRGSGFYISSHDIYCNHLVLASGIFTKLIPPRPLLQPLLQLSAPMPARRPILVVGSGFTAADVIISTPPEQKIIHIYKWAPSQHPSPLKACHQQAYPEYAGVYKRMKLAAISDRRPKDRRPSIARSGSTAFDLSRDWEGSYEGLPNTAIVGVEMHDDFATVSLKSEGDIFRRDISRLDYVVGRRGSLDFLDTELRRELCGNLEATEYLTGQTLRDQALENLEIASNLFIIGNLTGDSLIRFAYGGCAYTAGQIMKNDNTSNDHTPSKRASTRCSSRCGTPQIPAMNGLNGHEPIPNTFFSQPTVSD